nr:formin-like protein 18 [Aegilops tauschii subsp. strangulata]
MKPPLTRSQEHSPESHPAPLAIVQGPEQGRLDWSSANTQHQHARPSRARPPRCTQQQKLTRPPARRRAPPAPAGPPDLADLRPRRHRSHEREPPRAAHRAATKPSLPRRQGPPPRLRSPHQRDAPPSRANSLRAGLRRAPPPPAAAGFPRQRSPAAAREGRDEGRPEAGPVN